MEDIMRPTTSTALAALVLAFALQTPATAQDQVRVFEQAPSLDELRAILIPDSGPGMARRIEIPRQDLTPGPSVMAPSPVLAAAPQPALVQNGSAAQAEVAGAGAATAMPKHPTLKQAALPKSPGPEINAVAFRINFATASDAIPSSYQPHLDRIVDLLKQEPKLALTIEGHTDAYGSPEYNLELSRRRAVSVMRYLVAHGADGSRLIAVGKGKTAPLIDNPFDGRNRRVQFVSAGQSGT
jgi:outer membrane protein OmpA-like peptidoglycan-associated protein